MPETVDFHRPHAQSGPAGRVSPNGENTTKKHLAAPAAPPVPSADPAMFAGILGEIAMATVGTTEADPVGVFVSLLAGVGVFIGPGPHVRVGNTPHPLLIWPLMLGRTGVGRKGEATNTAEFFLRHAAPSSFEKRVVTGLSSGEGLIERIRDDDENEDSKDKRLLVVEPEFASVMSRCRREGSTLAFVQRQAWDGRPLMVLNRQQLCASGSHVGIIAHITPQEFRLRLSDGEMAGGTYNRYLPVFVEREKPIALPRGVTGHVVAVLGSSLREGIDAARQIGQMSLSPAAEELWVSELYGELSDTDDEDSTVAQFTERLPPYCLRVSALLAALDGRRVVSDMDLTAAVALMRYSRATARYVLGHQARNPRLDRIMRAVEAAGEPGLNKSAIWALFSRKLTREMLDELLGELLKGGRYECVRQSTGGRPAEMYRLVPSPSFVPTLVT